MTRTALEGTSLGMKEKDRCKNMFMLGFINWMYSRENALTEGFLRKKFSKKPDVLDANMKALSPATTTAKRARPSPRASR
jgi:2-oxoglutarate ferredoxin oxidoreductase subunit alpha